MISTRTLSNNHHSVGLFGNSVKFLYFFVTPVLQGAMCLGPKKCLSEGKERKIIFDVVVNFLLFMFSSYSMSTDITSMKTFFNCSW